MPLVPGYFKSLCQMLIDLMIIRDALVSGFRSRAQIYDAQRGISFVLFLSVSSLPIKEGNGMGQTMERKKFWVISKPKFKRWLAFYHFPVLGSFVIQSHWYLPLSSPEVWLAKYDMLICLKSLQGSLESTVRSYHWSWISENLLITIPLIKHIPSLKSEFQA